MWFVSENPGSNIEDDMVSLETFCTFFRIEFNARRRQAALLQSMAMTNGPAGYTVSSLSLVTVLTGVAKCPNFFLIVGQCVYSSVLFYT